MRKIVVCPHCGSKKIEKFDTFSRCEDCQRDFGRAALDDEGRNLTESVKGLRFRYGDVITGSVRLRFVEDPSKQALFEVYDSNDGLNKVAGIISEEEWNTLRKDLFEKVFVGDWEREYIPKNDGREIRGNNEWEFSTIVSEDEEYTYHGVDAYPVYWQDLLDLLEPYFNQLKHE